MYGNSAALSDLTGALNELRQDENVSDILLSVRGNASAEGNAYKNKLLAAKRAESLSRFLVSSCSVDGSLIRSLPEQPLSIETESLLSEFPDTLSGIDLPSIRRISRTTGGTGLKQAFIKLDGRSEGENWTWFKKNILEPSRFAEIKVVFKRTIPEAATVTVPVEPAPMASPQCPDPEPEPEPEPEPQSIPAETSPRATFASVKNNLLYDAALVANVGIEAGWSHFSFNLPVTYSPYDLFTNYRMRTLSFQPELRYYFRQDGFGHFVGLEGHLAYFNAITPFVKTTRFQDRDGEHPLYGGGLTYGYSMPLGKDRRWGIEFTLGAGYAFLDYDCFYNVPNGAWYTKDVRDYWGVTTAGINIFYRFVQKKSDRKR